MLLQRSTILQNNPTIEKSCVLQQDINVFSEWAKKWQLYFNISKVNVTGYTWDNHINFVNIQLTALLSHLVILLKIWEYK